MPFPTYSLEEGNAVELRYPDGLFYHGVVVDVVGPDLLVDIKANNSSALLIPCSEAFKCPWMPMSTHYHKSMVSDHELIYPLDVVVLMQLSSKKPWTWCPGTLIEKHNGSFAVVRVNGEEKIEVVPVDHVRFADKHLPEPVEPGVDFVKAVVNVRKPVGLGAEPLVNLTFWNRRLRDSGVTAVGVFEGKLTVIGSASDIAHLELGRSIWSCYLGKPLEDWELEDLPSVPNNKITASQEPPAASQENFISLLPTEALQKIFTFMDVYERVKARSVCRMWNHFLPLCAVTKPKSIWIDIDTSASAGREYEDYILKFGICLNKYYNERLDTIILSAAKDVQEVEFLLGPLAALDLLQSVLHRPQLKKVVLSNVKLVLGCGTAASINRRNWAFSKVAEILEAVCETVVFHQVSVHITDFPGFKVNNNIDITSRIFDLVEINGTIDLKKPDYDKEFFDVVEAGLESVTVEQMEQIGRMIKMERQADQDGIRYVYAVVESIQQCDQRPDAYHMGDISDPDLPDHLPKFNKLCLHALMKLNEFAEIQEKTTKESML